MTTETLRCADAADARREPLYGTASHVRRWLLLEQPGSWGPNALMESGLPRSVAATLRARAGSLGIRVILIRRGVRFSSERRRCYLIRTEDCDAYQASIALSRPEELLDLDLEPLRDGGRVEGAEETSDPLFLVCTHGRHDACCSIRGNQVSRIACAEPGLDAWECSHIGGDRFAANLVCFPHGIYYGRVGAEEVANLMRSFARGQISLDHYRGRCCYPFPVQAAEFFVRRETRVLDLDAVSLVDAARTPTGVRATFSLRDGATATVEVSATQGGRHRLTCSSQRAEPIPRYELVSCVLT